MSTAQWRVLRDIAVCRTAELGGHVEQCNECGHQRIAYNSCRNRHCPKCQAHKRAEWLEARCEDLLPVPYFHVVFTMPQEAAQIALHNKAVVYDILFRAAADTLKQIAADPKHLGAKVGVLAVLHTWGQTLVHHPHVHCVVPGGGLSADGQRWIPCRPNYFLPVQVLSAVYRGKFLDYLHKAYAKGDLVLAGRLEHLEHESAFEARCAKLRSKSWVVYAKPPFGGPQQVLKYLARYTHRVAIANSRLEAFDGCTVRFRYKNYAAGAAHRSMTLQAVEFLRRFCLHVLPKGFVRIRYYGLLAHRCRRDNVACARELLGDARTAQISVESVDADTLKSCPECDSGVMRIIERFKPGELPSVATPGPWDTS